MSLETLKPKVAKLIEKAQSGGNTDELENLIDQSGVLGSTDGTATEKVEQLIDKAKDENLWYELSEETTSMATFQNSALEKLPRMNPIKTTTMDYRFENMKNLKRVDFYLDTKNCTRCSGIFRGCSSLEYIKGINTAKVQTADYMFHNCPSLVTIEEPLDFSSLTKNCAGFSTNIGSLVEFRIVSKSLHFSFWVNSPLLSAESVQSIIDGLAIVETAQTLTLNASTKILQSQVDTANAKGWTIAGGTIVSEEEYYE